MLVCRRVASSAPAAFSAAERQLVAVACITDGSIDITSGSSSSSSGSNGSSRSSDAVDSTTLNNAVEGPLAQQGTAPWRDAGKAGKQL